MVRRLLYFFVSLGAVLAFAACSHEGASPKQVLRIAVRNEPASFDPLYAQTPYDNDLAALAFDLLVTNDAQGRPVPDLAATVPTLANGGISRDGLTITYHLRRDVRWQDGKPFTSRDVAFTWHAVMNPRNDVGDRRGYDDVARVATPDRHTVVFQLKRPFAPFVETVFGESDAPMRILPAHLLARYPDLNHRAFDTAPVGTGPYRLVRYVRGQYAEYAANRDYFLGKPSIARLIVRFIPDDATREMELRTHEIDFADYVSFATMHELVGIPGITVIEPHAPVVYELAMNTKRSPLASVRVRRAIAEAIDKATIVRTTTFGFGAVATADEDPGSPAYDPALRAQRYDPAAAKRALAAVKRPLELLAVAGNPTASSIAVQVQAMLAVVGVRANVRTVSPMLFGAPASMGGLLASGKFDLAVMPYDGGEDPDNSSRFSCSAIPPEGANMERLCDPRIDAAERAQLHSFDPAIRLAAFRTIERLLVRDVPGDFLFYGVPGDAFTSRLHGVAPNGSTQTWDAYRWSLR